MDLISLAEVQAEAQVEVPPSLDTRGRRLEAVLKGAQRGAWGVAQCHTGVAGAGPGAGLEVAMVVVWAPSQEMVQQGEGLAAVGLKPLEEMGG